MEPTAHEISEHIDRNVAQTKKLVEELNAQPTNDDILQAFDDHRIKDEEFQERTEAFQKAQEEVNASAEKSRDALHKKLDDIPNEERTAQIVEEVIRKTLLSKGKVFYSFTIGLGALAAALLAIFGGFKVLLALIGFSYLK
jgi:anti-sigma factor RsiW